VLDESNRFNQLDKMQNHMSKLITEQQGDVQAANKEDSEKINKDKKQSSASRDDLIASSSSSDDKKMTPPKGLKKQKIYSESSCDSEDK
jgi:hypothetical protein